VSAFAQSTVEAFGIVDVGYGVQQDKAADGSLVRKTAGVKDGALAGNRLGFRGTEDLGGGSAAKFWLEAGISPSTGSLLNERDGASGHVAVTRTSQTTRQAWGGLSNKDLGEIRVGYQNSLQYDLTSQRHALSIYPETRGGEAHNYTTAGTRLTAATYFSPTINNVEYSLQWAGAQDKGLTNTASGSASGNAYGSTAGQTYQANLLGLGAIYKNGPLQAGVVHIQTKVMGASPVPTSLPITSTTAAYVADNNAAVTNPDERLTSSTTLATKYDFGKFKLAGNYAKGKVQGATSTTAALSNRNHYELGLSVPVGATDLIASYGKGNTEAATNGTAEAHIKYVGIGAIQNLSKRTRLYALYGTQTDSQATGSTAAAKLSGTRVGISHAF
jgi:predicted porin